MVIFVTLLATEKYRSSWVRFRYCLSFPIYYAEIENNALEYCMKGIFRCCTTAYGLHYRAQLTPFSQKFEEKWNLQIPDETVNQVQKVQNHRADKLLSEIARFHLRAGHS